LSVQESSLLNLSNFLFTFLLIVGKHQFLRNKETVLTVGLGKTLLRIGWMHQNLFLQEKITFLEQENMVSICSLIL